MQGIPTTSVIESRTCAARGKVRYFDRKGNNVTKPLETLTAVASSSGDLSGGMASTIRPQVRHTNDTVPKTMSTMKLNVGHVVCAGRFRSGEIQNNEWRDDTSIETEITTTIRVGQMGHGDTMVI